MNEILFTLFLILIIIEIHLNISIEYAIIAATLIIFSLIFSKRKLILLRLKNTRKSILLIYLIFLITELMFTVFAVPINLTKFTLEGFNVYLASQVTTAIVVLYFSSRIKWDKFFTYIKYMAIILGAFGVVEVITKTYVLHHMFGFIKPFYLRYEHSVMFRSSVVFQNPSIAAIFFLLTLIILYYYRFNNIFIQILSTAICLINIYGTRTRIVWISTILFYLCKLVRIRKKKTDIFYVSKSKCKWRRGTKKAVAYILMAFLLVIVVGINFEKVVEIFADIFQYLGYVLNQGNAYGSREIRASNIVNVIKYMSENPWRIFWGEGLGAGLSFSNANVVRTTEGIVWNSGIDNQFLTTWLETGIIGIVAYVYILILAIKNAYKSTNPRRSLGAWCVISIMILSVSVDILWWKMGTFVLTIGVTMCEQCSIKCSKYNNATAVELGGIIHD